MGGVGRALGSRRLRRTRLALEHGSAKEDDFISLEDNLGSDDDWDKAESELREAVRVAGMATEEFGWGELPGEGAFYAPKLEWHLTDAIGRTWQVGTIQSDRVLPDRLDATYIGEDGEKHRPIMLHRAIFGSYERFIGILIEHYAGNFPLWLAPEQVRVLTVGDEEPLVNYARSIVQELRSHMVRADGDFGPDKINGKIQQAEQAKVHTMLVVGARDMQANAVSLRLHGKGNVGVRPGSEAIADILLSIKERRA